MMFASLAPVVTFLKRIPGWVWAVVIFIVFLKVKERSDRADERREVEAENREQTRQTMEAIEEESDAFEDMAERIRRQPLPPDLDELPDGRVRLPAHDRRG